MLKWGSKVKDYGEVSMDKGLTSWKWKSFKDLQAPKDQKNRLWLIITNELDRIRWFGAKSSSYNVNLGYKVKERALDKQD